MAPHRASFSYNLKQLTLDHAVALEAARQDLPRPPLVRLWQLLTGRPNDVLDGYGMVEKAGWPRGFHFGPRLFAMAVVVLSEIPRRRDTLLLRLMGRGRVLEEAIADLKALPDDAAERRPSQRQVWQHLTSRTNRRSSHRIARRVFSLWPFLASALARSAAASFLVGGSLKGSTRWERLSV